MISSGVQNPYNLNLNHLENLYSKVQAHYEDSTCEEMLLYKGTSRRATGIYKSISAMKQFQDTPIDELRVNIYACTGSEVLDCVHDSVQKGFQQPTATSLTQQPTGNFLGQTTNQTNTNIFGTSNTMANQTTQGGLSNNQMLNLNTGGNTMFPGLSGNTLTGGTFSNTNTNLLQPTNTNLLQQTNTNLLGGNAQTTSNQLGGTNLFQQANTNVPNLAMGGAQQSNTLFQTQNINQPTSGLFNTASGATNTNLLGGQTNQFKPGLSTTTGGLQTTNTLGGLTGLGTTNTMCGGGGGGTTQQSGGLFTQSGTNINQTNLGAAAFKSGGLFGGVSTNMLPQQQSGNLLQNTGSLTSGGLFASANVGGLTNASGALGLGGGVTGGLGGTSNTTGLGLGANNTLGLGTGLGGGTGLGAGLRTTGLGTTGLGTGLGTTGLGTGLGLGNTGLGLGNTGLGTGLSTKLSTNINQPTTNISGLNDTTISTSQPGQNSLTLTLRNTSGLNSMEVNVDELMEFRRQRQINRYMDSMRNHKITSTSDAQLSDTSLVQATSKTSSKILSSNLNGGSIEPIKFKSPITPIGLPTSFSQITKMYTNKGLSNIQHYAHTRDRLFDSKNMSSVPYGNNFTNSLFEAPTGIEVGDETTKLVRSALKASKRNSILNRSDTLPLINIKTELDQSIRYPQSVYKRHQTSLHTDLESTRCDRCSKSHSSQSDNFPARTNKTIQTVNEGSASVFSATTQNVHKKGLNDSIFCSSRNQDVQSKSVNFATTNTINERPATTHQTRVNDGYSTSSNDFEDAVGSSGRLEISKEKRKRALQHDVDQSSYGAMEDNYSPTKCNITLKRPDYYTKPSLRELDELCVDGKCLVKGFVVGRKHYGFATFPDAIDVFGLNLDEIVIFNRALVEIYPDNYPNKPPQGQCLNRRAIITLYNVFPYDFSESGGIVKDLQVLSSATYIETMENLTLSLGALFLDYNPIDGTWTFEVPHFTKYGLDISHHGSSSMMLCKENVSLLSNQDQQPNFLPSILVVDGESRTSNLAGKRIKTSFKRRASGISEICETSSDEHDMIDQVSNHSKNLTPSPTKLGKDMFTEGCSPSATFPKYLQPDPINQYSYQPLIYASTKPYESSSVAIDNSRALVECFIEQQCKCCLKSIGNCLAVNSETLLWDMSLLLRSSSHIGCLSYIMAYVQPRSIVKNINVTSLTPQVVHAINTKQLGPCDQNYMDPKTLDYMFSLLSRFSSQKDPSNASGVAQRKINSSLAALQMIDEFVDYYTLHSATLNSYYLGPLFILMKNLFVSGEMLTINNKTTSVESHRKTQLLGWLKMMTQHTVTNAVNHISTDECNRSDPYRAVKISNYYISSQRCNQATDTLANSHFDQLALLSTLVHADDVTKYRVSCQIDKWRQMNTLDNVGDEVLTLLSIISGTNSYPALLSSSTPFSYNDQSNYNNSFLNESANQQQFIGENVMYYPYWVNFDWISAFGLYLFNFHTKSNPTIKEVFTRFTTDVANISKQYSHCRLFNELGDDSLTRFFSKLSRSLFYLYCGNVQPFSELVDEFVVINEHYSPTIPIIWFVVVLLNQLLTTHTFSKLLRTTVTTRFAELLENHGQWDKAIMVLNFSDSMPAYCRQVEDILMRNYHYSIPQEKSEFLRQHNLMPRCDRDIIKVCSVAHIKSYPVENLKLLQEIISDHKNSLEYDLERDGGHHLSLEISKHISTIEMVLYRLTQFRAQSPTDRSTVEQLHRHCVDMFCAINNKTMELAYY